jgi:hypothetical protein
VGELPHSVEVAQRIDKQTGTDFWRKAVKHKMANLASAFRFLDDDEATPIGYQQIGCHVIARLVPGGHKTDPPKYDPTKDMTYASVVSRESV